MKIVRIVKKKKKEMSSLCTAFLVMRQMTSASELELFVDFQSTFWKRWDGCCFLAYVQQHNVYYDEVMMCKKGVTNLSEWGGKWRGAPTSFSTLLHHAPR